MCGRIGELKWMFCVVVCLPFVFSSVDILESKNRIRKRREGEHTNESVFILVRRRIPIHISPEFIRHVLVSKVCLVNVRERERRT